jgi:polysaccharide chain length determinant protein (PEP-CTERM system associated)
MRGNIKVGLEGLTQEAFRVSYVSSDARVAQKVTERLASWYIEENLRDRENLAASTNEFLAAELEDAKRRLLDHEKKLEEYRRRYSGQLPSQLETNIQSMQNTQLQLQSASDSINRARERRLLIERQLADAQMLPLGALSSEVSGGTQEPEQLSSQQQLENAKAALARARLRYTPDHPDIRAFERVIRDLQAKVDQESRAPQPDVAKVLSPAEALRQKRVKDYQAELEAIDRQIATSQADQARLQRTMSEYQAKLDALPSRESELVELTRDYSTLQATYTSLLTKREDSKLATNLERRQIGEQFKVLDPASLPERPVNAKTRILVMAGGSVGGLLLGLLAVGFLEYRDSTFKTEADVTRVLSLPVLALVPLMLSEHEQQVLRRRRRVRAGIATAVLVVGSAAAMAFWRLQS